MQRRPLTLLLTCLEHALTMCLLAVHQLLPVSWETIDMTRSESRNSLEP